MCSCVTYHVLSCCLAYLQQLWGTAQWQPAEASGLQGGLHVYHLLAVFDLHEKPCKSSVMLSVSVVICCKFTFPAKFFKCIMCNVLDQFYLVGSVPVTLS